ncbi:MAG: response regulator [Desulfosudaceae bacterium]
MEVKQPIKILVVDDEKDIREGCVRVLRRVKDCEVQAASNGKEGLDLIEEDSFSIVLLDLKMPGIDGMDVLREIQDREEDILVIIITGFATVETAIEAMKQGAYDFIPKPFDPAQLRIVVERAMEKIRLQQETERLAAERQKTLADLDTEKSRISAIVASLPNGMVVTDISGQVVLINPAFKEIAGLDQQASAGSDISTYIEDEGFCEMVRNLSRGGGDKSDDVSIYELEGAGGKFLIARGRSVFSEAGDCIGAVVTLGDITSIKMLDQLKSEFVAKVSHELRSPLSTIHEQLGVVLKDMAGGDTETHDEQYLISRAKEKTSALISLIGDLLDLSRIEAGGTVHNIRQIKVEELLSSIVDFLGSRAEAKQQKISLELGQSEFPELTADPMALESIFGNLVTNAINYTGEGGEITVSMDLVDESLRVKVADNGFGIEERHQEKIFEKFYRVKDDNTRYITGTGLGLPIVKGLVEKMNGTITLESAPGQGSVFTVTLPVKS